MLLESFTKHLGQPRITFPSPFCVAGAGGGQLSPAFTSMRLKSSWRVEIRPEYSKAPC